MNTKQRDIMHWELFSQMTKVRDLNGAQKPQQNSNVHENIQNNDDDDEPASLMIKPKDSDQDSVHYPTLEKIDTLDKKCKSNQTIEASLNEEDIIKSLKIGTSRNQLVKNSNLTSSKDESLEKKSSVNSNKNNKHSEVFGKSVQSVETDQFNESFIRSSNADSATGK